MFARSRHDRGVCRGPASLERCLVAQNQGFLRPRRLERALGVGHSGRGRAPCIQRGGISVCTLGVAGAPRGSGVHQCTEDLFQTRCLRKLPLLYPPCLRSRSVLSRSYRQALNPYGLIRTTDRAYMYIRGLSPTCHSLANKALLRDIRLASTLR